MSPWGDVTFYICATSPPGDATFYICSASLWYEAQVHEVSTMTPCKPFPLFFLFFFLFFFMWWLEKEGMVCRLCIKSFHFSAAHFQGRYMHSENACMSAGIMQGYSCAIFQKCSQCCLWNSSTHGFIDNCPFKIDCPPLPLSMSLSWSWRRSIVCCPACPHVVFQVLSFFRTVMSLTGNSGRLTQQPQEQRYRLLSVCAVFSCVQTMSVVWNF